MKLKITRPLRSRGFALVITLSLMILLTVIAVGLLTLSTVSLRSSSQGDAMQVARANARVALMLAIGEVQRTTGPDQRITIPADQRKSGADGKKSSAAPENIHWTGVFKSWPDTSTTRPTPEFQAWLVSGVPDQIRKENLPDTATGNNAVELVGTGTLGSTSTGQVKVPSLSVLQNKKPARLAYWVGDQGLKATLVTPPLSTDKTSLGVVRGNLQSAPRNAVEIASTGTLKPFENLAADDVRLPLVTDWRQTELLASDTSAPRGLFHDLAAHSSGLLTNVAAGGFRRDLSLQLERPLSNNKTPLYTVGGKNGINLEAAQLFICKSFQDGFGG